MCKVSIVMPVYNKERYIKKTIQSILSQTFDDWELIIIDDGSTDHSFQLCQQFSDQRIHLYHTSNKGVSHARNVGIQNARGEYITFVDGDDTVSKDYLRNLYRPDKEMIIGGLTKVDSHGEELEVIMPPFLGDVSVHTVMKTFYSDQSNSGIYGFISSKLIRNRIIRDNNLRFDESIKLAEDYDFFLSVYDKVNSFFFLNNADYYYKQGADNSSVSAEEPDYFPQIRIRSKAMSLIRKDHAISKEEKDIYESEIAGYIYTVLLNAAKKDFRRFTDDYRQLKQIKKDTVCAGIGISGIIRFLYNLDFRVCIYVLLTLKRTIKLWW